MPESPDFDQIARAAAPYIGDDLIERIAEQLRQVWNARGAADIATIEHGLPDVWTAAAPVGALTRVLRRLDR